MPKRLFFDKSKITTCLTTYDTYNQFRSCVAGTIPDTLPTAVAVSVPVVAGASATTTATTTTTTTPTTTIVATTTTPNTNCRWR